MPSSRPKFFRTLQITAYVSAISAGAACSPDAVGTATPGPTGDALETAVAEQFGGVARPLLSRASGFTPSVSGDRFVGPMPTDWKKGLFTELPKNAASAIRFQAPDGFTLEVWDDARRGEAKETAHTVSYARDQGTAIWKAGDGYAEQWLYLPNGSAVRDVASYRWKGGEARQHGRSVDIYDDAGKARITVSAPEALTVEGEHLNVAMELRGERLWVVLDKAVEAPLLVDPVWVAAGDMGVPRMHHRSELLQDGRVLAVGGISDPVGNELATAELFDPATDTWSFAASMAVGRYYHTLTILNDGRALVVGGEHQPSIDSEVYDPALDAWQVTTQPAYRRIENTATRLPDGRVLVAGGAANANAPFWADIYDPLSNTWVPTSPMLKSRQGHLATLLPSGDVFVSEGTGDTSTEAYSPLTDVWLARASGSYGHANTDPVPMLDGTVVYPGGTLGTGVERYDPQDDSWTILASTNVIRNLCPALLGPDGLVLSIGGGTGSFVVYSSTELYDVMTDTWTLGPSLLQARNNHRANLLKDGRVLVVGGYDPPNALNSCELLLPFQVENGGDCAKDNECVSAHCVEGMCCDALCTAACYSCKATEGAAQDGFCSPITGFGCDDGNLCTTGDICAAGVCMATPTVCPDQGECRIPYCDAATGDCLAANKPAGTPCGVSGVCDNYGDCFDPPGTGGAGGEGGAGGFGGAGGGSAQGGAGGMGGFGGSVDVVSTAASASGTTDASTSSGSVLSDTVSPAGGCSVGRADAATRSTWWLLVAGFLMRAKRRSTRRSAASRADL